MSSIATWTNQGSAYLGVLGPAQLYDESRCATFCREWKCRTCGETRFVEGASLTPPLRQCRWCGKDGSDWVSVEVDFKTKQDTTTCCVAPPARAPIRVPLGAPPRGPRKALLIGLNYHSAGDDLALRGSHADVRFMQAFLTHQGWPTDDGSLRVLTDQAQPVSRDQLLEALDWLLKDAQVGSNLFLQFSGHGVPEESCLLSSDCDVVLEEELWESVTARVPRGARLTALVDCFQPMTVLRTPKTYTVVNQMIYSELDHRLARPIAFPGDVLVIGAGRSVTEPFHEGPDNRDTGAVFHAFMTAVLKAGTQLSYHELLRLMAENFQTRRLHSMTPTLGVLDPHEFDPKTPLCFTADRAKLKPISPAQREAFVKAMPVLISEQPEPEPTVDLPVHVHGPHCQGKDCCALYQQYDAQRAPVRSLAMVPIVTI